MQPMDSGSQEAIIGQQQQSHAQARGLLKTFNGLAESVSTMSIE
jgi:hypothetical protein